MILTADNIQNEFNRMYSEVPAKFHSRKLGCGMNSKTYGLFFKSFELGWVNPEITKGEIKFNGIPLIITPGTPDDFMFIAEEELIIDTIKTYYALRVLRFVM